MYDDLTLQQELNDVRGMLTNLPTRHAAPSGSSTMVIRLTDVDYGDGTTAATYAWVKQKYDGTNGWVDGGVTGTLDKDAAQEINGFKYAVCKNTLVSDSPGHVHSLVDSWKQNGQRFFIWHHGYSIEGKIKSSTSMAVYDSSDTDKTSGQTEHFDNPAGWNTPTGAYIKCSLVNGSWKPDVIACSGTDGT